MRVNLWLCCQAQGGLVLTFINQSKENFVLLSDPSDASVCLSLLNLDATSPWPRVSTWPWAELQLGPQAQARPRLPKTWVEPSASWSTYLTARSRWTTRWASALVFELKCIRSWKFPFHLCLCQQNGLHLSLKLSANLYVFPFSSSVFLHHLERWLKLWSFLY